VLGCLLVHGYKGQPYVGWLLACCLVLGVLVLLALILEAFKLQVRPFYLWCVVWCAAASRGKVRRLFSIGKALYTYGDEKLTACLLACCLVLGVLVLLALILEAFQLQVRPVSCSVAVLFIVQLPHQHVLYCELAKVMWCHATDSMPASRMPDSYPHQLMPPSSAVNSPLEVSTTFPFCPADAAHAALRPPHRHHAASDARLQALQAPH
jgi:hypothetical protein